MPLMPKRVKHRKAQRGSRSGTAYRGATVAFMILVNNPGSWQHIYSPLEHAKWHGLTPTDLVFPFFLFAVGNAMAFVQPRLKQAGDAAFWKKIIIRTVLIFAIGIFLNWFPFVQWQNDELVAKGWTWTRSDGEEGGIGSGGRVVPPQGLLPRTGAGPVRCGPSSSPPVARPCSRS